MTADGGGLSADCDVSIGLESGCLVDCRLRKRHTQTNLLTEVMIVQSLQTNMTMTNMIIIYGSILIQ